MLIHIEEKKDTIDIDIQGLNMIEMCSIFACVIFERVKDAPFQDKEKFVKFFYDSMEEVTIDYLHESNTQD